MSLCVIHCVNEAASSALFALTEQRLANLKQRITYILQHKDDTRETIFKIASSNKALLDVEFKIASAVYYHSSCYKKFIHNRYLHIVKRPVKVKSSATQKVKSLPDQVSKVQHT